MDEMQSATTPEERTDELSLHLIVTAAGWDASKPTLRSVIPPPRPPRPKTWGWHPTALWKLTYPLHLSLKAINTLELFNQLDILLLGIFRGGLIVRDFLPSVELGFPLFYPEASA
jgi:hypothetical protein